MKSELQIRLLEPADVPALLPIIADSRAEYGMADRGVDLLEPADEALFETYKRQRSLYFVALSGGEVVGGAGVAPLKGSDPLTCELQRMYLRRDARGRGIGEALLKRCLAAARQLLYVRCYLETVKQMTQPEIMLMLQRTARIAREGDEPESVSLFRLLRELRHPEVKLGLHRALGLLRGLGSGSDPIATTGEEKR